MPQNKRESLIYTVMMCFVMVFWMSMYNVTLHSGHFDLEVLKLGWIGFPIAYVFAMICDWFVASKLAKGFSFRYLVSADSAPMKKILSISCCMVVVMVCIMSFYGGLEMCVSTGAWDRLGIIWLTNIPRNFIMALPFQLLVAGPIVRKVFRKLFPEGKVLA